MSRNAKWQEIDLTGMFRYDANGKKWKPLVSHKSRVILDAVVEPRMSESRFTSYNQPTIDAESPCAWDEADYYRAYGKYSGKLFCYLWRNERFDGQGGSKISYSIERPNSEGKCLHKSASGSHDSIEECIERLRGLR